MKLLVGVVLVHTVLLQGREGRWRGGEGRGEGGGGGGGEWGRLVCVLTGVGVGGISVYLVNFGVYWIPNIIGGLNRDTEIPILFGFTLYELHF